MKAFVSLHTAAPQGQIDNEVEYQGYKRMPVEFDDEFGEVVLNLTFPVIEEDSEDVVTYIGIGSAEHGQGEIFMRVPAIPNIPCRAAKERLTREFWASQGAKESEISKCIEEHGYIAPRIAICNTNPVKLPDNLNPIARTAHKLVYAGLLDPLDLPPKLFEAINDALHNAGVPVLKIVREGAAKIDVKFSDIRLDDWGNNPAGHA